MLFLIPYAVAFWIFALISTIIKAVRKNEILFQKDRIMKLPTGLFITIKILPELLAIIFIILVMPSLNLFYLVLITALVFCLLGDIGMEIKFMMGVGFFLIAQFIFIGNFIWHSALLGVSFLPLAAFVTLFITWVVVIIFLTQYIESGATDLGSMKRPLQFYAITVSFMSCSALLFWLTSGILLGFIPVIGAVSFVISDMLIGVKEFHHHFNKAEVIIFLSYYLATFLLSLSVVIYIFI